MPESAQDPERTATGGRFSAYLRRCRVARRLSLRQVEKLSESHSERVSNSYVAYCETGRLTPSLGKLITLSKVLGIPLQNFTERIEMDREPADLPAGPPLDTWRQAREAGIREAEAGRLRAAFACFERAHALAADDPLARLDLGMDMAIALKRMSRHCMARDLLEEILSDLTRRLDDAARMERALILLAGVLREMDRLPIAAMAAREALERARASEEPAREAHAASVLANCLYDLGDAAAAGPLYERAITIYRQSGDDVSLVANLANLGNCRSAEGRIPEALRTLREAEGIAARHGFSRHLADIESYVGRARLAQGHEAAAEKHFYRSNRMARAGSYDDILFGNTWRLRAIAESRGDTATAEEHLRTLRYLRSRVQCSTAEIRAFDRLVNRSRGRARGRSGDARPS